jgi:hypothetical protein
MFMSMGWDSVSEQHLPTDLLFIPQIIYKYEDTVNINRGRPKNAEKNLSQCHFILHKSHTGWSVHKPGPAFWEAGY